MTFHTISVLVENKFGVLARVAGMFSGRGYNIRSLNVGPSHDPKISRMTIVVKEKENVLNQIIKQLDKLIDVIQVIDFREGDYVDRELVLLQIQVDRQTRPEAIEICQLFRAKIIDVGRFSGSRSLIRLPRISRSPEVMVSKPAIMRRVVVLPQPDGPRKAMNSPLSTSRLKSMTAGVPLS